MRKLITLLFVVVCVVQYAGAQSLHVDSTRFITGNKPATQINYAIPTTDKGVLFVGFAGGNPGGIIPYFPIDTVLSNVMIGKIDSNQQISWIKIYGGSQEEGAGPTVQTPDGGYAVLAGTTSRNGDVTGFKGGSDIWLLRLDYAGNLLWQKTYGSSQSDGAISIANTRDHGFIILGFTNGSDGDVPFHYGSFWTMDWLVVKTDSMGNVQWSKDLGTSDDDGGNGAILAIDSVYYLISSAGGSVDHDCTDTAWHSGTLTGFDLYVLKLDALGNVLWDSSYGGSNTDGAYCAIHDSRDSSIVINGYTVSNDYMVTGNNGGVDMWVVKIDKNGTLLWQKTIGTPSAESGYGICEAPGGGYMVYGGTNGVIGGSDAWLINIDGAGNKIADKIFGGVHPDKVSSVVPYLNGYAAMGTSQSSVFTEGTCNVNYSGAFISYIGFSPMSINELTLSAGGTLRAYPNPAKDKLTLDFPENKGAIQIVNTMGQVFYSNEFVDKSNIDVDTKEWADGLYSIIWRGENGNVITTKFIKN
jgi:Secretion system C-terminal sorting domain